jgi:hypothetical protein
MATALEITDQPNLHGVALVRTVAGTRTIFNRETGNYEPDVGQLTYTLPWSMWVVVLPIFQRLALQIEGRSDNQILALARRVIRDRDWSGV